MDEKPSFKKFDRRVQRMWRLVVDDWNTVYIHIYIHIIRIQ